MKRSSFSPNQNNSQNKRTKSTNKITNGATSSTNVNVDHSHSHLVSSSDSLDPFPKISKSMWTYYTKNAQSYECFQKKKDLKDALQHMFEDIFPYLGVYIVGSSTNGFGTNQSDVDICLMVSLEEINQKSEALLLLRAIAKAMRKTTFIRNLNVIAAKCPIIKFHDNFNNLDCDINLNNHIGIRNTHLMKVYSDIDWRVKPLVLNIKHWAKHHGINDASQRTISSYSFALLAIFYLQAKCDPPVLPVLQKLEPDKFNTKTDIRTLRLNDDRYLTSEFTSSNNQSLGELFNGFLDYYASFNFNESVISVRLGELIPKNTMPEDEHESLKSGYIKIEEPFDLTNTARSVYDLETFREIKNVFKKSAGMLRSNKTMESVTTKKFADLDNAGYDNW